MKCYTVFVADDEAIVLDYFLSVFPWEQSGLRLVGSASSGKEAVESCIRLEPDLIVLDISMPGMSGLEVMERLTPLLPRSSFVFITSHEDFGYAHGALRLGALDYILKASMTPAELQEKFFTIRNRMLEREKREGESVEEKFLRSLPSLPQSGIPDTPGSLQLIPGRIRDRFPATGYGVMLLRFVPRETEPAADSGPELLSGNHAEKLNGLLDDLALQAHFMHAELNESQQVLILHPESGDEAGLEFLAQAVLKTLTDKFGMAVRIHGGISTVHAVLNEIGQAYSEAKEALSSLFYHPDRTVCRYDGIWKSLDAQVERRLDMMKEGETAGKTSQDVALRYREQIRRMVRLARESRLAPDDTRMIVAGYLNRLATSLGGDDSAWKTSLWPLQAARCPTCKELEAWADDRISFILLTSGITRLKPQIQRVLDEVEKTFSAPLDLTDAAQTAAMHPNYFSAVFKKEIGQTFIEYLNTVRIRHALEYIDEGVWQMQQIAEMVGIPNYRTFFNTFQRVMKMTPTDYLQKRSGAPRSTGSEPGSGAHA